MGRNYPAIVLVLIVLAAAGWRYLGDSDLSEDKESGKQGAPAKPSKVRSEREISMKAEAGHGLADRPPPSQSMAVEEGLPASGVPQGVNPAFRDSPEVQKAWMSRARAMTLKSHDHAESADFRGTFFHRGFKDRPVACGEVALLFAGAVSEGYQRYIYVGGQISYFENDVENFQILWDKLCVERYR